MCCHTLECAPQAAKARVAQSGDSAGEGASGIAPKRQLLPKLSISGKRPSDGVSPKDTARRTTPRSPHSPGVLYVDNV